MRDESYFCLDLTENEHHIIEGYILDFIERNELDLELVYYRQLKEGHVPCHREVKLRGPDLNYFQRFIDEHSIDDHMVPNPWRV